MKRVFNFGAGPAMLPLEVMQQAQAEFLNYQNLGASVIEISHRSGEFDDIINRCEHLRRDEPGNLPLEFRPG